MVQRMSILYTLKKQWILYSMECRPKYNSLDLEYSIHCGGIESFQIGACLKSLQRAAL
jgi:hypothetical protein